MAEAGRRYNLPIITEVLSVEDVARVAEKADISQTQLSKMELGQCDATTGVASAVARALGVGLSEILVSENPTKPRPKKERQAGRKPGWFARLMAQ